MPSRSAQTAPRPEPTSPHTDPATFPLWHSVEIQGNIIAGFRKDYQTFVFVELPDGKPRDVQRRRRWLTEVVSRIATTRDVADFNRRFSEARRNRGGDDPETLTAKWWNMGVTHAGLLLLAPNIANDLQALDAFTQGPAARAAALGDTGLSDPSRWVVGRDQADVHAIINIAADRRDDLLLELEKLRQLCGRFGVVTVFEQSGQTLSGARAGHEHFGFKDGISQPGVVGFDEIDPKSGRPGEHPEPQVKGHLGSDILAPGEFVLGYRRQGGGAPRRFAAWMKDGSFQVWRRLAQDVPGFWAQVTAQSNSPGWAEPPSEDLLAAKLVGRWRSGTPLDIAPERDDRSGRNPSGDNDFDYTNPDGSQDDAGFRCPRFAHIRKMYPRDNDQFGDEQRRILRRGIPFGLPFDPAAGRGHGVDAPRGLLFQAFMSSIEDQFEFLQQAWANNASFPDGSAGPDPVIGDAARPAPVTLRREGHPDQQLEFHRFVHTTGALYAFAPSLSTLRQLADGTL